MNRLTKAEARRMEPAIVASILENVRVPLTPWLCHFIAHWQDFEHPEASKLACGILKARNYTKASVMLQVGPEYAMWCLHPLFLFGLPLPLAELDAECLVRYYEAKRISALLGESYNESKGHPEKCREIVVKLKEQLEVFA